MLVEVRRALKQPCLIVIKMETRKTVLVLVYMNSYYKGLRSYLIYLSLSHSPNVKFPSEIPIKGNHKLKILLHLSFHLTNNRRILNSQPSDLMCHGTKVYDLVEAIMNL